MVKITIENLGEKVVEAAKADKSVLKLLHDHAVDWMHACGGKGRCTTCMMIVTRGMENLSEPTAAEEKFRSQNRLAQNERLACQARATGAVHIRVAEAYKLPHVKYSV